MGLFADGWAELKRKWERRRFRKLLCAHDRALSTRFGQLGQRALESGIDLAAHAVLHDEISRLEGRAGELAASRQKFEAERAALEHRRNTENARFDDSRAAIEAKKQPVDSQWLAARERQTRQQAEVNTAAARLRAMTADLERLRGQRAALSAGAAADSEAQLIALESNIEQLVAQQPAAAEQLAKATDAMAPLTDTANRWSSQAQQFAAELAQVEAERQAALDAIAAETNRLSKALQAIGEGARIASQERWARYIELGRAIYAGERSDARIAEQVSAVQTEAQRRAATQATLESSERTSLTLPPNAFLKFVATMLMLLVAAIAISFTGYAGWDWWQERKVERELASQQQAAAINPYLDHALKDEPAYVLANQLADAKTAKDAQKTLLQTFRALGLGVYTPTGKQIQAGAERSDKDFFLYDFQLRTLARSQIHPSFISFTDLSHVIDEALVQSEVPGLMQSVLGHAVSARYEEATRNPQDPANFIVLFMDGLARRQPIPYSLEDLRDGSEIQISPVQSLLLVMEFFMRPRPEPVSWMPDWNLIPSAYAQSPCDWIKGDDAQNNFGKGSDLVISIASEIPGKIKNIASMIGEVTGVIGLAGDMLTLYGIDIHVQPQPDVIHLLHDEPFVAGIQTLVSFDAEVVSDQVLKCGWMAGKKMPVKGPLSKVELTWEFSPTLPPYLEMHTDMTSMLTGHLGLQTRTDQWGMSMFLIQPKVCPEREGRIVGQDYLATVSARVVTADIPTPSFSLGHGVILKLVPGTIEYFMRGRKGYARFRAEWHTREPERRQYQVASNTNEA